MSAVKKIIGRPAEAHSIEWNGDLASLPASWRALDLFELDDEGSLTIRTTRGPVPCWLGDRIIRRKAGDFYPIDPLTYAERWEEQ